jgi:hypothetical protein
MEDEKNGLVAANQHLEKQASVRAVLTSSLMVANADLQHKNDELIARVNVVSAESSDRLSKIVKDQKTVVQQTERIQRLTQQLRDANEALGLPADATADATAFDLDKRLAHAKLVTTREEALEEQFIVYQQQLDQAVHKARNVLDSINSEIKVGKTKLTIMAQSMIDLVARN